MSESDAPRPAWLSSRLLHSAIYGGGVALALAAAGLSFAFGNVLAILPDATGGGYILILFSLLLLSTFTRWAVERFASTPGTAAPRVSILTMIRIGYLLALLVAVSILATGWAIAALVAAALAPIFLDALLLALVGSLLFITFPLSILDNGSRTALALARRVAGG